MADEIIVMLTVLVVGVSVLFDWWYFHWLPSKKLPPGPAPWPIVGSLFKLRSLGANPMTIAMKLEAEYGKIVTLWVGKKPVIVISDEVLAHDALVKRGVLFGNKCTLSSKSELSDGFPMINTSNGAYSILLRRLLTSQVLNSTRVKAMKPKRGAVIEELIKEVKVAIQVSAKVPISDLVRLAFVQYSTYVCFALDLEHAEILKFDQVMHDRVRLGHAFYLGDYIPICKVFERNLRSEFVRSKLSMFETINPYVQRLREKKQKGRIQVGNYVETLLDLQDKEGTEFLSDLAIAALCSEVVVSSTHTLAASVTCALSIIARYKNLQVKLSKEIEDAVGSKPVEEADLPMLPYLDAVCKEVLRIHPPIPIIPHSVSESCELGGYLIPTDAVVLFHVEEFQHNADRWTEPWDFKPERFLNKEVDLVGTRDLNFIPFGAGRRLCPGLNLAMLLFGLAVARLVQTFEWDVEDSSFKKNQHVASDQSPNNGCNKSTINGFHEARDAESNFLLQHDKNTPLIPRLRS